MIRFYCILQKDPSAMDLGEKKSWSLTLGGLGSTALHLWELL